VAIEWPSSGQERPATGVSAIERRRIGGHLAEPEPADDGVGRDVGLAA
jgi:hypothetical protein